jgi:hypothetical protein
MLCGLALTSCAGLERVVGEARKWREEISAIQTKVEAVAATAQEADKNSDGKVDLKELLAWLLGAGGLGAIASVLRNGKSNERKARIEGKLESLSS